MSGSDNAAVARLWFASADHDRKIIKAILPEQLWAGVCFHAQQCAEKSVKGMLVSLDIPFRKTHSIGDLLDLMEAQIPADLLVHMPMPEMRRAAKLDRYYLPSRYPDVQISLKTVDDSYDTEDAYDSIKKADYLYAITLEIAHSVLGQPVYPTDQRAPKPMDVPAVVRELEQFISRYGQSQSSMNISVDASDRPPEPGKPPSGKSSKPSR